MNTESSVDADNRATQFARHADLDWVATVLAAQRDSILNRWLASARAQPFHASKPEGAVADHIPALFDSIVALLQRSAPSWIEPAAPLDDPDVLRDASEHARLRFLQGLEPADVVTEFRLLRQEIGRTLRLHLADNAPTSDILAAELLVHDALDAAITLALLALSRHIEEVRQDFLATTLHDVQQPLATIKARVQLAQRELRRAEPRLGQTIDGLQHVNDEVDRLTRMLGGLADASRLALGQFELRLSRFDLLAVVRDGIARLAPHDAERTHLQAGPGPVVGEWDRDLMERVLDNMLSNAVKYSAPGSPIEVSLQAVAGVAQLAVHDHGMGLSSEDLEHVFARYRRAPAAVERGISGQGLGLYLSLGVIEAHHGRMWLESPGPGFGTTVFVRVPCSPDGERRAAA